PSKKRHRRARFPLQGGGSIMAKRADSVVGIDLGKHMLKGVALRRKSDSRFVLTSLAARPVPEEFASADDLARELKQLIRDLGGSAKACAFEIGRASCREREQWRGGGGWVNEKKSCSVG